MATETYEVGPRSVFDHEPGTQFDADLNPVQRARLLESGALRRVGETAEGSDVRDSLDPELLKELKGKKRPELDAIAEQMGIEGAADLKNADAVIDAIAAHEGGSTEGDGQNG